MEIDPGTSFQLSRAELEEPAQSAEEPAGTRDSAEQLARSVASSAAERCMSALLASQGEMKRVDLWVHGEVLVIHGYSKDRDQSCPGSFYRGRESALVAISQFLGSPHPTSVQHGAQRKSSFEGFQELIEHVAKQLEPDGQDMRMCALTPSPADPEAEVLMVTGPQPLRWTVARQQDSFDLIETGMAQMWGHVIEMVDAAFACPERDAQGGSSD